MKTAKALLLFFFVIWGAALTAKKLDPSTYRVQSLENARINCVEIGADKAWVGSERGLMCYDPVNAKLLKTYTTQNSGLPASYITALAVRDGKELWIGTTAGLAVMDLSQSKITIPKNSPFKEAGIQCIGVDRSGGLWIGASSVSPEGDWIVGMGLSGYDGKAWKRFTRANSSLSEDWIGSIVTGADNTVWLGTTYNPFEQDEGSGLCSFDGKNFVKHESNIGFSYVDCLSMDETGRLWMGLSLHTEGGVHGGGLASFDTRVWTWYDQINSDIPGNVVTAVCPSPGGVIWMGMLDEYEGSPTPVGLVKFDGQAWQVIGSELLPTSSGWINAIKADPEGKLWVGTDSGLAVISFPAPKPAAPVEFVPYEDPPSIIGSIRPEYPAAAKKARVQGTVILEVEVYKDGSIGNIKVARSVPGLDDAAIEAVRKVKFKPGKASGKPVDTTVIIPIDFRLN